jgi:uncharacterized membrane protein
MRRNEKGTSMTDTRADPRPAGVGRALFGGLHALLGAFPLAYFVFAFVTDIVYTRTYNLAWQYFSIWLITAGLVMGGASILFGAIDWLVTRTSGTHRRAGWHILLTVVAWLLALVNAFVHSRDGWTAVSPEGIILSGIVALLMLLAASMSAVTWRRDVR